MSSDSASDEATAQLTRLKALIHTLEEHLGWEFDATDFDDRVRLQKYVYLAEDFGFSHDYEYNLHHYGPYSPSLASDYYDDRLRTLPVQSLEEPVEIEEYEKIVSDKDREWLEIAATIRRIHRKYEPVSDVDYEWIISRTSELKETSEERVIEIYEDLEDSGIVGRE